MFAVPSDHTHTWHWAGWHISQCLSIPPVPLPPSLLLSPLAEAVSPILFIALCSTTHFKQASERFLFPQGFSWSQEAQPNRARHAEEPTKLSLNTQGRGVGHGAWHDDLPTAPALGPSSGIAQGMLAQSADWTLLAHEELQETILYSPLC